MGVMSVPVVSHAFPSSVPPGRHPAISCHPLYRMPPRGRAGACTMSGFGTGIGWLGVGAETVERTFSFVDLAGFSALTEAHGDLDAVDLLDRFIGLAREALSAGDELVKSIGDAVMLASPGPAAAVATLAGLWERCSETSGFLLPRAGAHHGPAISRDGDYLGATVNLAARVAGHAGGGQILVTSGVARAASDTGFEVARLGPHRLHNVTAPVELFEIRFDASDPPGTI